MEVTFGIKSSLRLLTECFILVGTAMFEATFNLGNQLFQPQKRLAKWRQSFVKNRFCQKHHNFVHFGPYE